MSSNCHATTPRRKRFGLRLQGSGDLVLVSTLEASLQLFFFLCVMMIRADLNVIFVDLTCMLLVTCWGYFHYFVRARVCVYRAASI